MTTKQKNMLIKELQEEREDLVGKINRLSAFLDSPHPESEWKSYTGLSFEETYSVMDNQLKAMESYKAFLSERIGLLKNSYKGYKGLSD